MHFTNFCSGFALELPKTRISPKPLPRLLVQQDLYFTLYIFQFWWHESRHLSSNANRYSSGSRWFQSAGIEMPCTYHSTRRLIRGAILNLDITNCRSVCMKTFMNKKYFKFPIGWMINIPNLFGTNDPLFKYFWELDCLLHIDWLKIFKQFLIGKRDLWSCGLQSV